MTAVTLALFVYIARVGNIHGNTSFCNSLGIKIEINGTEDTR